MQTIKVLGSGCANCETTVELITEIANAENIQINLEKVEDMAQIMAYGVMSTPGVVINETVVHAGSIPDKDTIKGWLSSASDSLTPTKDDKKSGGCCGSCC
jgi:small redox-active disulfide protein 2